MLIGIVGFGGMFAFYTYIHTTLTDVSGLPGGLVPIALMLFGLGMVAGNIVGGALADRSVTLTLAVGLAAIAGVLLAFAAFAGIVWVAVPLVFAVGVTGSALVPALQTRLMDTAEDAQTLAAALNHSALNVANAAGAWLGAWSSVPVSATGRRRCSVRVSRWPVSSCWWWQPWRPAAARWSPPGAAVSAPLPRLAARVHHRHHGQRQRDPRGGEGAQPRQPRDPAVAR